ncbi:MAG: hypothetical protein JW953_07005 [Anaerolineae bacterium]|nr:hypothetical protein [Anaerolineae bacterium]
MNKREAILSLLDNGLDRKGIAPDKFILAADCTLPADVDWDNVKTAINTAHEYKR